MISYPGTVYGSTMSCSPTLSCSPSMTCVPGMSVMAGSPIRTGFNCNPCEEPLFDAAFFVPGTLMFGRHISKGIPPIFVSAAADYSNIQIWHKVVSDDDAEKVVKKLSDEAKEQLVKNINIFRGIPDEKDTSGYHKVAYEMLVTLAEIVKNYKDDPTHVENYDRYTDSVIVSIFDYFVCGKYLTVDPRYGGLCEMFQRNVIPNYFRERMNYNFGVCQKTAEAKSIRFHATSDCDQQRQVKTSAVHLLNMLRMRKSCTYDCLTFQKVDEKGRPIEYKCEDGSPARLDATGSPVRGGACDVSPMRDANGQEPAIVFGGCSPMRAMCGPVDYGACGSPVRGPKVVIIDKKGKKKKVVESDSDSESE